MKNVFSLIALVASLVAAPAFATVIDFEASGTPGEYNSLDYEIDGFVFNPTLDNIDLTVGWWANTGPAHSGAFAALNNYGGFGEITRANGGTFSFQSLWAKNWFNGSDRSGQVIGLLGGTEVGSVTATTNGSWTQITGNFAQIDTLRIQLDDIFVIDDIVLDAPGAPADVPEPGSLALLGLGLAGFAARARKART